MKKNLKKLMIEGSSWIQQKTIGIGTHTDSLLKKHQKTLTETVCDPNQDRWQFGWLPLRRFIGLSLYNFT